VSFFYACRESRVDLGSTAAKGLLEFAPQTGFQWPVWRHRPQRSDKLAALARKCCVSEGGKMNVGFVRIADIVQRTANGSYADNV
jgi:hypothetical protein